MPNIENVDCKCLPCCYTGCCPCMTGITGVVATFDSPDCAGFDGEEITMPFTWDGTPTWATSSHVLSCGASIDILLRCTAGPPVSKGDCNDFELELTISADPRS